ncbi:MAG: hypothetical protein H8E20_08390 [Verrucomicrobia bacterium]|nr:hypothetical protein [Verrucomicrobiota bacterium]
MTDLFKFHATRGFNRSLLILAVLVVVTPGWGTHSTRAADSRGAVRAQTLDELEQSMQNLIDKAYSESRVFLYCDVIRLYVRKFAASGENDLYLSKLRGIKDKLLARGRESLAKANAADQPLTAYYLSQTTAGHSGDALGQAMESEARRLAGGDEALAKGLLERHEATLALYLDAALFLSAHCLIFPNSADSHRQLGDAAKCAEIAGFPLLEVEFRSRLMRREHGSPAYPVARQLSEKATLQNRFFIAISVLDRFLSENYSHPMAGYGYLASGDIHQLAGCYDVAKSKYNQALLWSADMDKISRSQSSEADLLRQNVAEIKKRASLSIGYAILAEARGKHLRESTAAFAGKLHGEAVTHFDRLVATVESGSLSSLDYLLGQIRSSAAAARYKRAHSFVLGLNEIQDAYARCIPACEIYLRVLNQVESKELISSASNDDDGDEVAFVLLEALHAIGKAEEGKALFFRYFIRPEGGPGSIWAVLAKTRIAKGLVDDGDYLTAYPLLSEVVRDARQSGLRDIGFTAALMTGICISRLNPVAQGAAPANDLVKHGRKGELHASAVHMAREAYSSALAILADPVDPDPVHYPDEYRGIFLDNIREELLAEYRGELALLQSGWSPLGSPSQETSLVDALSALDPAMYPFNPNNLLVAAYLNAHRELGGQGVLASKETTQNGKISHK